ncbi:MAG TPA: hypothetical protein VFU22_27045 [Roseiflexaceae bacterium]|nr:hypothetical protein [Roseiflexaceae bacterium]
MASHMIVEQGRQQLDQAASFERFGGLCAFLAGAGAAQEGPTHADRSGVGAR